MFFKNVMNKAKNNKGSAFTVLLGGVVLIGVLSFTAYRVISGPVASMVKTSNKRMTDLQFITTARMIIMDSVDNDSDCDSDGYVEPMEFTDNSEKPTGGGIVGTTTLGTPVVDVWGTSIGYCVWDVDTSDAAGCGGSSQDRLQGDDDLTTGTPDAQTVFAFVSAGPNKKFETTCADHSNDSTVLVSSAAGSDDIIKKFSYDDALKLSGGLWSFKAGDMGTVQSDQGIFVGGSGLGTFSSNVTANGRIIAGGGIQIGTEADGAACSSASDEGTIRFNTVSSKIEVCDGADWQVATGIGEGGAGASAYPNKIINDVGTTCGSTAAAGDINYDSATKTVQFCDGSDWQTLYSEEPNMRGLHFSTESNASDRLETFTITGPGFPANTANRTTTLRHYSGPSFGPISSVYLTNTDNFEITTDNCTGKTLGLSSGEDKDCTIQVRAKTDTGMNGTFVGRVVVKVDDDNIITDMMKVVVSGYCEAGVAEEGGLTIGCTQDHKYVMMEFGCGTGTAEPTCDGDLNNTLSLQAATSNITYPVAVTTDGAANTTAIVGVSGGGGVTYPAAEYCDTLVHNTYSDWFLPSSSEWALFWFNQKPLDDLLTLGSHYAWSSNNAPWYDDNTFVQGSAFQLSDGNDLSVEGYDKTDTHKVLCFRKVAR